MQFQSNENTKAILLANNMTGITKKLEDAFRKFETASLSTSALHQKIQETFNSNYTNDLIKPTIHELTLRCQRRDQITSIVSDSDTIVLDNNQLKLEADGRISVADTLRHYYLQQVEEDSPNIDIRNCAIFGFSEFFTQHFSALQKTFFSEENSKQQLIAAFYLATLHGNAGTMQSIWQLAAPLGIQHTMICHSHFNVVAAGQAATHPEVMPIIQNCIAELTLTDNIPEFTDQEMFTLYARAGNVEKLKACWKKPRTPQDYLSLLCIDNNAILSDTLDDYQVSTATALINCLIKLKQSEKIAIPNEVWQHYFQTAVMKAPLHCVEMIWNATEDTSLQKELIDNTIICAADDQHVPVMKFLLEKASSFNTNPITAETLEYIKQMVPHGMPRLGELFDNSPLTSNPHTQQVVK